MLKIMSLFIFFYYCSSSNAKILCEGNCQPESQTKKRKMNAVDENRKSNENSVKSSSKNQSTQLEQSEDESHTEEFESIHTEIKTQPSKYPKVGKKYAAQYLQKNNEVDSNNQDESVYYEEKTLGSNLPLYFSKLSAEVEMNESFVLIPKIEAKSKLAYLFPGSIIKIIIDQDIVASQKVSTPVTGKVISGPYKGSQIFGEAKLEDDLKRVLIDFKSISGGYIVSIARQILANSLYSLGV